MAMPSFKDFGQQCASLLAGCMGALPEQPCRIVLPTQIFHGESTRPPVPQPVWGP